MNNIKQKNIIQSFNTSDQMPYGSDDVRFVNNQTIDANSLNNRLQQMVDNDLFVENSIKNFSDYQVGPKYTIDAGSDTLNGNKYFDGYDDILDKLSILQKVNKPYQETLSCVISDNVNYITQYNGIYYAGTINKILSSGDGYQWSDFETGASYCYYQDEGIFLLGHGGGILSVNQNNKQQLKNETTTNIFSNGEYATAIGVDRVVTPLEGGLNIVVGTNGGSTPRVYFGQLNGKNVTFSASKEIPQSGVPRDIRHRDFDWGYNLTNYVMIGADNAIMQSKFKEEITDKQTVGGIDRVSDGCISGDNLYVLDNQTLKCVKGTYVTQVSDKTIKKIKSNGESGENFRLYVVYQNGTKAKFGYVSENGDTISVVDVDIQPNDVVYNNLKDFDIIVKCENTYIFVVLNSSNKVKCYYRKPYGDGATISQDFNVGVTINSIHTILNDTQIIMYLTTSSGQLRDYRLELNGDSLERVTFINTLSSFTPTGQNTGNMGIYGTEDGIYFISQSKNKIYKYPDMTTDETSFHSFDADYTCQWMKKLNLRTLGVGFVVLSKNGSNKKMSFFKQRGERYDFDFSDNFPISYSIDDIAVLQNFTYIKSGDEILLCETDIDYLGNKIHLDYKTKATIASEELFPFVNTDNALLKNGAVINKLTVTYKTTVANNTIGVSSSYYDGDFKTFVGDCIPVRVKDGSTTTTKALIYNNLQVNPDVDDRGNATLAPGYGTTLKDIQHNPPLFSKNPFGTNIIGVKSTDTEADVYLYDLRDDRPTISPYVEMKLPYGVNEVNFIYPDSNNTNNYIIRSGTNLYGIVQDSERKTIGNINILYMPIPQGGQNEYFYCSDNKVRFNRSNTTIDDYATIEGTPVIFDSVLYTKDNKKLRVYNYYQEEDVMAGNPCTAYTNNLTLDLTGTIDNIYCVRGDRALVSLVGNTDKLYFDNYSDYQPNGQYQDAHEITSFSKNKTNSSNKRYSYDFTLSTETNPNDISTTYIDITTDQIKWADSYIDFQDKQESGKVKSRAFITTTAYKEEDIIISARATYDTNNKINGITNKKTGKRYFSIIRFYTADYDDGTYSVADGITSTTYYNPSKLTSVTIRNGSVWYESTSNSDYIRKSIYDSNTKYLYCLFNNNNSLKTYNLESTTSSDAKLSNLQLIETKTNIRDIFATSSKTRKFGWLNTNNEVYIPSLTKTYIGITDVDNGVFKQNDLEIAVRNSSNTIVDILLENTFKFNRLTTNANWSKFVFDDGTNSTYKYYALTAGEIKCGDSYNSMNTPLSVGNSKLTGVDDFDVRYDILYYTTDRKSIKIADKESTGKFVTRRTLNPIIADGKEIGKIKIADQDIDEIDNGGGTERLMIKLRTTSDHTYDDYYSHLQTTLPYPSKSSTAIQSNVSKIVNENNGTIYSLDSSGDIKLINTSGDTTSKKTGASSLYPADEGFVYGTASGITTGLKYYKNGTTSIDLGSTPQFSGDIKGFVKYGNDYYAESNSKLQNSNYNKQSTIAQPPTPTTVVVDTPSQIMKQNNNLIMVQNDQSFNKYDSITHEINELVNVSAEQSKLIILQTDGNQDLDFVTGKKNSSNGVYYKPNNDDWQFWDADNRMMLSSASMGFKTKTNSTYTVNNGKLIKFGELSTGRDLETIDNGIGAQKFIDIGDDEYLVTTLSSGVQRRKHNSMIPLTNNDLSVHSLEFGNFDAQNPRVFFDSNNEVKMASSYKKMSSQSETFLSVGGTDTKIRSIIPNNWNNFIIGTDKGIYTTKYEYELVDNLSYFTEDDINEIYDTQLSTLSSGVNTKLTNHNETYHGSNNLIPYINDNIVGVNFENANIDNILSTIEFGDMNNSELTVYTHNFLVDDTPKFNYIKKTYLAGDMVELYVLIDTTNTYYINDTAHDGREVKNYQRANLKEFGEKSESISCTSDEYIENKYKTEISVAFISSYSNYKLLDAQMNGCSLPLKIYKYTDPDAPALDQNSLTGMYNSSIVQTKIVYNDESSSTDHVLYNNGDVKYLKAYCFGTDQQSLRVLLKKNANI